MGELGFTRLRGWLAAIDPLNLIRVIPAEGRCEARFSAGTRLSTELKEVSRKTSAIGGTNQQPQVLGRKEKFNLRVMTEVAALVALAGALQAIKVYRLPQGGAVTLAGMVPILLLSLRRGWKLGTLGGVLLGLIAIIEEPEGVYYPTQAVLDYPVAFGALGLAGFFPKLPVVGAIVGIAGRFLAHFVSGVIFFASFAPVGMSPEVYSAIYNGSYILPELVISAVVVQLLTFAKALELYR